MARIGEGKLGRALELRASMLIILFQNDDNSAEWTWVDDTELQYTDWLSGQNGNGRCAQIAYAVHRGELNSVSRGWQQVDCRLSMKALCKAPRMAVDP